MKEKVRIGLDLGGTKIEAVALRSAPFEAPDIALRRRIPTEQKRGYEAIVASAAALLREVAAEVGEDIGHVPIGVGMPGGVTRAGLVKNSNTTCLNGRPFRADLEALLGRPIGFDNDANCFALAEAQYGAAKAHRDGVVFGVILGTGVGGGVVFRGEVWQGRHGIAGEWGHHAVFPDRGPICYCGKRGCLELFASGPAVEKSYESLSGNALPLADIALLRHRDPHAKAAIESFLEAFSRGLANVIDILDPSAVVLGGGLSNLDFLYDEGRDRVAALVFNDELSAPILKHELGDSAGVIGAAAIAL